MGESGKKPETEDLGVFSRRGRPPGLTATEIIALALSAFWLLAVTVFFFVVSRTEDMVFSGPEQILMIVVGVFVPLALIWIATTAASSARIVRDESERLQASLDAMRNAYVSQQQASTGMRSAAFEKKLDAIMAAQRQTETALATFSSIRPGKPAMLIPEAAPLPVPEDQATLALGSATDEPAAPLSSEDFIKALNFPETVDDKDGFRALRLAMQDRRVSELIQASQDILTLLSQEGIYMDDMRPDHASPEVWRRFARGERGRPVAAMGGIRDRSGVVLTAARMRKDHIFRDTAHHFLRRFDKVFAEFEETATDAEIEALSDTRSARAFMLLGRVAGTFT